MSERRTNCAVLWLLQERAEDHCSNLSFHLIVIYSYGWLLQMPFQGQQSKFLVKYWWWWETASVLVEFAQVPPWSVMYPECPADVRQNGKRAVMAQHKLVLRKVKLWQRTQWNAVKSTEVFTLVCQVKRSIHSVYRTGWMSGHPFWWSRRITSY